MAENGGNGGLGTALIGEPLTELTAYHRERPVEPAPRDDGWAVLADVTEREISWFWRGRIAWGNVVVVAGDGGVGKSTLGQELGARMSRGQSPPGGVQSEPRGVVVLSAEEDASVVIRPRMRLMGADLQLVMVRSEEEFGFTLPSGEGELDAICEEVAAGLLIVDTGPAYLDPGLNSNSEEDVRRFLAPLRRIAESRRLITLVFVHLNKDTTRAARHRVMGGAAWVNAPRQVLMVGAPPGKDPRETGERLVAVEKNNLGVYPPAHAFRLAPAADDPSRAVVAWGQEVEGVRSADLVGEPPSGEERTGRDAACEFLTEELSKGERPVKDLREEAEKVGHKWSTVEKAKGALGVEASRQGGLGPGGSWVWKLPES